MYVTFALTAVLLATDGSARLRAALDAEARGDDAAALSAVEGLIRDTPTWELPRLEAVRLRLKMGQGLELAEFHADVARSLAPENARAHYLWALVEDERGHRPEARRALELALFYRPDFAEAQTRLGAVLCTEGDYRAAVKVYQAFLAKNPTDVGAKLQLALAQERSGDGPSAEATLRSLAAKAPASRPVALRNLAALLEREGKAKEAEQVRESIDGPSKKMRELKRSAH